MNARRNFQHFLHVCLLATLCGGFSLPAASQVLATLTSPAPGSVLPGSTATFKWTAGSGVSGYWLHLGTTGAGSENLYSSGSIKTTSVTVTGLPLTGATIYATIYSEVNGAWEPTNYTYTETDLAALTSPVAGTVLPGSSVTFKWTAGKGVPAYWLHLGTTGAGSENLYSSGSLTTTSVTVTGLPMKATKIYATLYSSVQGVWTPVDYTYTEPALPALTSPAAGSILPGKTATFKWTAGTGITAYWLHLGTTGAGSDNLYSSGSLTGTSVTVSNLPLNGVKIYATLYASIDGGAWLATPDNAYTEAALAALTSPASGSVLSGTSATFKWSAGTGITAYWLHLGTTGEGSDDIYSSGSVSSTSITVNGLPTYGMTVYATLYSNLSGTWTPLGYTVTEAGKPVLAALTSPAQGSVLPGSSATFTWSAGHGPTAYWLHIGTTSGSDNLYSSGSVTGTSLTVKGLPTSGVKVYAGLYSLVNGTWQPENYTLTEAAPAVAAVSCTSVSVIGPATDACTVTLDSAALSGAVTVNLTSNNTAVKVPATVTVPSGGISAAFNATVAAVQSSQSVLISAVAGGATEAVAVEVAAPAPALTLSASTVPFGNVNVNTAVSQQVTVTSTGTQALTINSVTASGAGFSASGGSFPVTLNPNQTATVQVQFDPTAAGAAAGTLTISSNAASGGTTTVSLSGTGMPTPSAVSCVNASITGAGTDSCTVTLNAAAASGGTVVSLSSNNAAVSVPSSVTVGSGATSAGFVATVSAVGTAQTVAITATASSVSQTFSLSLGAAASILSVSSSSIQFGSVTINDPATQSLTLTSTGSSSVTVNSATATGTGFSVSGVSFPITLSPNQTATLEVQFDPTTAGSASGAVTISSNSSAGSSFLVSLSGSGVTPGSYQVNLTWDAPTGSSVTISGYSVYRATSGSSSYQLLNGSLDTQTSYSDSSVSSGVTYDYYVETVDSAGVSSAPSEVLSISVP